MRTDPRRVRRPMDIMNFISLTQVLDTTDTVQILILILPKKFENKKILNALS